jgi:hypothetical protein
MSTIYRAGEIFHKWYLETTDFGEPFMEMFDCLADAFHKGREYHRQWPEKYIRLGKITKHVYDDAIFDLPTIGK